MPTASKPSSRKKPAQDMTVPNRNNKFLSLVSLVTPFFMLPVVGIVSGHVALKEYSKENADQTWKPLALAGTIAGYVVLFVQINMVLIMGAFLSTQASYNHYNHDMYSYDMPMNNNDMYQTMPMGDTMMGESNMMLPDGTITFVDGIPMQELAQ